MKVLSVVPKLNYFVNSYFRKREMNFISENLLIYLCLQIILPYVIETLCILNTKHFNLYIFNENICYKS